MDLKAKLYLFRIMASNRVGVRPAIEDQVQKGKFRSANVALYQAKYAGLKNVELKRQT